MIRYKSNSQLSIEEFKTPFEINLDKNNRWVKLAYLLPWDKLAQVYYSKMCRDNGAPMIDARIVIGALIVKHKQKLSDRETIEYIRENPYVQYFLGMSSYTTEAVFDRSLFTTIRYRLGINEFNMLNEIIISMAEEVERGKKVKESQSKKKSVKGDKKQVEEEKKEGQNLDMQSNSAQSTEQTQSTEPSHRGKLLIDATVANQMIVFPTDLGLLNNARQESERIIDLLHKINPEGKKPRTYRKKARQQFLQIAKKKKKTKSEIRKGLGQQLRYLKRNLDSINRQLDELEKKGIQHWPLSHRDQKIFWVIQHIYLQQLEMYKNKRHRIENRIVNVYQPHVRPIVRGKEHAQVEFGAKLGVSLQNGFALINTFSWESYNESTDLKKQVDDYKKQHGYYPEAVVADAIYGTRKNREFLKTIAVRFVGKPLGRPPKEELSNYQKRKQKMELNQRNQIEGKFGQGKNGYNLNKIRARQKRTSESWVSCIFFVMNIVTLMKLALKNGTDLLFSFFIQPLLSDLIEIFPKIYLEKNKWKTTEFFIV